MTNGAGHHEESTKQNKGKKTDPAKTPKQESRPSHPKHGQVDASKKLIR